MAGFGRPGRRIARGHDRPRQLPRRDRHTHAEDLADAATEIMLLVVDDEINEIGAVEPIPGQAARVTGMLTAEVSVPLTPQHSNPGLGTGSGGAVRT